MPAGLPGSTLAENLANPSAGQQVIIDALSGPKGSPLDNDQAGNVSTGAMCTGIGFGGNAGTPINVNKGTSPATAPQAISDAGFTDDTGNGIGSDSTRVYIGGGNTVLGAADENVAGEGGCVPYTSGHVPVNAGNGGSRDAGAGPAFTGFMGKWVTAAADAIDNGDVVETGWVNRSGVLINETESVFGSDVAAQGAPSTS